jgi:hypothetical protein
VDEFWVCQHCRSLNRSGTGRCYHCREKIGSQPKELPKPAARPAGPAASIGQIGSSMGSGAAAGAAGFGPPISSPASGEAPAYLSRPAAIPLAPARDFSAPRAVVEPQRKPRYRPELTGWIRRRISWSLATRQFVPVRVIGYVSAVLVTGLLLNGALIVSTISPVARTALQSGSLTTAWSQIEPSHRGTLELMLGTFVAVGSLALLFFSLLIGFSTHNAPGLGAEMPFLTPYRAGTAWLRVLTAQARLAMALLLPAVLIWRGYALLGLIAAFVAVELAQRRTEDPFGWLSNPARHLPDLFAKLGVSGPGGSFLGSAWALCFRAANALLIAAYALPLLTISAFALANISGHGDVLAWRTSGYGPIQLVVAAVVVLMILATSATVVLLVPVAIELVERQKTRQTMVRVGRSRSWVGRPGNVSASGLGAPTRVDERSEQDPDQASLNSPSTTSSFPWDVPSEDSAPPD